MDVMDDQQLAAALPARPAARPRPPLAVSPPQVLLIGEPGESRAGLEAVMNRLGASTQAVGHGATALHRMFRRRYRMAVILPPLPDITAVSLCRMIGEQFHGGSQPGLVVLAPGVTADGVVELYDAGADSVITESASLREVVAARVEGVLRRVDRSMTYGVFRSSPLAS